MEGIVGIIEFEASLFSLPRGVHGPDWKDFEAYGEWKKFDHSHSDWVSQNTSSFRLFSMQRRSYPLTSSSVKRAGTTI